MYWWASLPEIKAWLIDWLTWRTKSRIYRCTERNNPTIKTHLRRGCLCSFYKGLTEGDQPLNPARQCDILTGLCDGDRNSILGHDTNSKALRAAGGSVLGGGRQKGKPTGWSEPLMVVNRQNNQQRISGYCSRPSGGATMQLMTRSLSLSICCLWRHTHYRAGPIAILVDTNRFVLRIPIWFARS